MFKVKSETGKNNICGSNLKKFRKEIKPKISQRQFAEILQREGIDLDKNAIQRIEAGQRFVTDIELKAIAKIFNVSYEDLLDE